MGFCLFNNVAVAARHALDAHGAERVLDPRLGRAPRQRHQRDLPRSRPRCCSRASTSGRSIPGTGPLADVGEGAGEGFSINLPVPGRLGRRRVLSLVEHVVVPAAREFEPDLVLVSAGFDAHRDDPVGGCRAGDVARYARAGAPVRVADELGAPVGAVLEGGYDLARWPGRSPRRWRRWPTGGEPASHPRGELVDARRRQRSASAGRSSGSSA